jgi:hypothetical protein
VLQVALVNNVTLFRLKDKPCDDLNDCSFILEIGKNAKKSDYGDHPCGRRHRLKTKELVYLRT